MARTKRPVAFWFIILFLALSIVLLVLGQTISVLDYDLTVWIGLQESPAEVGAHGVQVNRAFGAGDTIVYIPHRTRGSAGFPDRRVVQEALVASDHGGGGRYLGLLDRDDWIHACIPPGNAGLQLHASAGDMDFRWRLYAVRNLVPVLPAVARRIAPAIAWVALAVDPEDAGPRSALLISDVGLSIPKRLVEESQSYAASSG